MGEVVLSSEEAMEMELEAEKNETKKDGSSEVVRWGRFLPRVVLRVLLVYGFWVNDKRKRVEVESGQISGNLCYLFAYIFVSSNRENLPKVKSSKLSDGKDKGVSEGRAATFSLQAYCRGWSSPRCSEYSFWLWSNHWCASCQPYGCGLAVLAFTGSTETGQSVLKLAAKSNLKPVTLELGGKSPFIICEDADIDHAVELAHFAFFFNQGQCCWAGSHTYVHEPVYDEFVEKSKARAIKRINGDPFKKGIEQGIFIRCVLLKVLRYIRSGIESNATLECGGDRFGTRGYFVQPTIFSNVQDNMLIAQNEIFGPVQSILKLRSENFHNVMELKSESHELDDLCFSSALQKQYDGLCGYGSNCCFNHRAYAAEGAKHREELPEIVGQPNYGLQFSPSKTAEHGMLYFYTHRLDYKAAGDSFDLYYGLFMYNVNAMEQLEVGFGFWIIEEAASWLSAWCSLEATVRKCRDIP
ncbi:hypothetical protein Pint_33499 [Pistacia integerrima]|uniref:Uncharacterized protein n=1 Tax=Pistacia integerrima TaxID=434235 RepID=A0ACC0X676_9ROSI|nr:hypothetical protein Pint_33499 [Pistacia integerrima]